jgi:hypothetical protein
MSWSVAYRRQCVRVVSRACSVRNTRWSLAVLSAAVLAAGCSTSTVQRSQPPTVPAVAAGFGDAYSRWQVAAPGLPGENNDVQFVGRLLLVSQGDGTMIRVTAYHEATGTVAWSRLYQQEPAVLGNVLLVTKTPRR